MTTYDVTTSESVFDSSGERCVGTLWRPTGVAKPPLVLMAHGFAALRSFRLPAFAERFAQAGVAAYAFDYRTFGDSSGQPRHWVSPKRHLQDWTAALAHVRGLPDIDADRIVLWGTSYSGGHVLQFAAQRPDIVAAIIQAPHVSGIATAFNLPFLNLAKATIAGLTDLAGGAIGHPHYSPVVGRPGEFAAMSSAEVWDGWFAMTSPGQVWDNKVLSRAFLTLPLFSPIFTARRVAVPTLVIVGTNDTVTPPAAATRAAAKIPKGELHVLPCNHFQPYVDPVFSDNIAIQLDFLRRHGLANAID